MTPEEALAEALNPPAPDDVEGLADVAGGNGRLARLVLGIPLGGRLPRAGTAARKAYNAQIRGIQRWRNYETWVAGGRKAPYDKNKMRNPRPASIARLQRSMQDQMTALFITQLRKAGARCRIDADEVIMGGSDAAAGTIRSRVMPAHPSPGVYIPPAWVASFTDPFEAGDMSTAVENFELAFAAGYDDVEIQLLDVDEIKLWPEGTAEP